MGLFSKKKAEAAVPEAITAEVVEQESGSAEAADDAATGELIAVLSAAIAAYEAEQFVQTLYIQKINRANRPLPVWANMGTQEAIDSRRM